MARSTTSDDPTPMPSYDTGCERHNLVCEHNADQYLELAIDHHRDGNCNQAAAAALCLRQCKLLDTYSAYSHVFRSAS